MPSSWLTSPSRCPKGPVLIFGTSSIQIEQGSEEESGTEPDDSNYELESEGAPESMADQDDHNDELLARELDLQLNQNLRGRPTRRAARRANKRLQVRQSNVGIAVMVWILIMVNACSDPALG